jgi:hypothetical protein
MPYADRQQQLAYMRKYMKRRRVVARLERLKQRKQELLKRFDEEPAMKYFIKKEEVGMYIDAEVEKLEGLLKNGLNSNNLGGTRKP